MRRGRGLIDPEAKKGAGPNAKGRGGAYSEKEERDQLLRGGGGARLDEREKGAGPYSEMAKKEGPGSQKGRGLTKKEAGSYSE